MTLPRFFMLMVAALAALTTAVLLLAVRAAGTAVARQGESARSARAAQVSRAIEGDLDVAERAIQDFERAITEGILTPGDGASTKRFLIGELIALRGLTDLTFTSGVLLRYDDEGNAILAATGRAQHSAYRDHDDHIHYRAPPAFTPGGPGDPTLHDTFQAASHRDARGQALWSDLAFSQLDGEMPRSLRRKTMTVQKAVFANSDGGRDEFLGVVRAGMVSDELDRLGAVDADDPHRIFICDEHGRLITRLGPHDSYQTVDNDGQPAPDGDVRVAPARLPPEVAKALALARSGGKREQRTIVDGVAYYITLWPIAEGRAQEWLAGLVVPERYYVGTLTSARDRLLILLTLAVVAMAVLGTAGARVVGRGVKSLVASTEAMRAFHFMPAAQASPFTEIRGALASVERAKTALRAMVKYVPVDLVRTLYERGRDPELGAEACEISIMFTDIAEFTTHAESLGPDELAQALGAYLDVATRSIEATGGTVDKYIGDALMVLWNAPSPDPSHPVAACRAALACARATRALVTSQAWRDKGLAPWRTRFGIHTDTVLVGNFGSPSRLNYSAMGDGVNLASRLEGLNKVYGTTILVSADVRQHVRQRVGEDFLFRLVDRVAVKGKSRAVDIHELIGSSGEASTEARRPLVHCYERALAAAFERRFAEALEILDGLSAADRDGPSELLRQRCTTWLASPPPEDWDGTWVATSK
jgi:adenylate cyclase